jgi:hypothetical protein
LIHQIYWLYPRKLRVLDRYHACYERLFLPRNQIAWTIYPTSHMEFQHQCRKHLFPSTSQEYPLHTAQKSLTWFLSCLALWTLTHLTKDQVALIVLFSCLYISWGYTTLLISWSNRFPNLKYRYYPLYSQKRLWTRFCPSRYHISEYSLLPQLLRGCWNYKGFS